MLFLFQLTLLLELIKLSPMGELFSSNLRLLANSFTIYFLVLFSVLFDNLDQHRVVLPVESL